MNLEKIGDIFLIHPDIITDNRGFFMESYREDKFSEMGIPPFVQDNHSRSKKDTIRGLHYQPGMGKLMRVTRGNALLAALNLRTGVPFITLASEYNRVMVWAPDYFARGFLSLTDDTEVQYKCTAIYDPRTEGAIRWDSAGINWPITKPIISLKDSQAPTFEEWRGY